MNSISGFLSPKWQTILTSFLPSGKAPFSQKYWTQLPDGDQILWLDSHPSQWSVGDPVVVLFHGLCGNYNSKYMIRLARKYHKKGVRVIRVNHRGANKESLLRAKNIYHAGRSEDMWFILNQIHVRFSGSKLHVIGFSISGNMLLKMLGERGHHATEFIDSTIAVCPPVDLKRRSQKLSHSSNRLFDRFFVKKIDQMRKKRFKYHPSIYQPHLKAHQKWMISQMTLYDVDDLYTSREIGFENALSYYEASSSFSFLSSICVPTQIVFDDDDPFVCNQILLDSTLKKSTHVALYRTKGGGHMGYLSKGKGLFLYQFQLDIIIMRLLGV